MLSEVLPSPIRPLPVITRDPTVTRIQLPQGPADLYEPKGGVAPGIVLVHGANPRGIDDPRVQGMASAFARAHRIVLAPALTLAERRLDRDDTARIREAIRYLADRTGKPVVAVAFSYGAAYTLIALEEEPNLQRRMAALATIGAYFDLAHLIEGVTTGQVYIDGVYHEWRPPPEAREQATRILSTFLSAPDRESFLLAYRIHDPQGLSDEALAMYHLMTNQDPRRTPELIDRLPLPLRNLFSELSPAQRIEQVRIPVYALHSRVDPAAPPVESSELVKAVGRRAPARLTLVGSLRHVTPIGSFANRVRDGPALVSFAATILRTQEPWLPVPASRD